MLILVVHHEGLAVHVNNRRQGYFNLLVARPVGCRKALDLEVDHLLLVGVRFFKRCDFILCRLNVGHHPFEILDLSHAAVDLHVGDDELLSLHVF